MVRHLEDRRQELVVSTGAAAESGDRIEIFRRVEHRISQFTEDVRQVYGTQQFPDLNEAMTLLSDCNRILSEATS